MIILKEFDIDIIKKELTGKKYNVVAMNYDKIDGFKICNSLEEIGKEFYKLHIFNEEFMITAFNFGNGEIKYNKVESQEIENAIEKEVYIDAKEYIDATKLKIKVGFVGNKEVVQYIGFLGGER